MSKVDVQTSLPDTACSVCGAQMEPSSDRCLSCGATRGEQHRCPFCRVVAEPERSAALKYACPACGAPRIPLYDPELRLSKPAVEALTRARSARASRAVWKLSSALVAAFGVLAALLLVGVVTIASPPGVAVFAAAVVTAMPFMFAAIAQMHARKRTTEVDEQLDQAWLEAAKGLTKTRPEVRAGDIANLLGLESAEADRLFVRLASSNEVSSEVTDEGELALSVGAPRIRVAEPSAERVEPAEVEHVEADESSSARKSGA